MLGGFSASIFYRILVHLRNTIASIVPGDMGVDLESPGPSPAQASGAPAVSAATDRLAIAVHLMQLRQQISSEMNATQLTQEIDRLVAVLVTPATETIE
jgi:hypothetical protein